MRPTNEPVRWKNNPLVGRIEPYPPLTRPALAPAFAPKNVGFAEKLPKVTRGVAVVVSNWVRLNTLLNSTRMFKFTRSVNRKLRLRFIFSVGVRCQRKSRIEL